VLSRYPRISSFISESKEKPIDQALDRPESACKDSSIKVTYALPSDEGRVRGAIEIKLTEGV
jgi:hypothetical protein